MIHLPPFYRAEENLSEEFNARENRLHGIGTVTGALEPKSLMVTYELVFNQEVDGGGVRSNLHSLNWE